MGKQDDFDAQLRVKDDMQVVELQAPFRGTNYKVCSDGKRLSGNFNKPEITDDQITLTGFLYTDISCYEYDFKQKQAVEKELNYEKPVCLVFKRELGSGDYKREIDDFRLLKFVFEFVGKEGEFISIPSLPLADADYGDFRNSVLKLHSDPALEDPIGDWNLLTATPPPKVLSNGNKVDVPPRVSIAALKEDEDSEIIEKLKALSTPALGSGKGRYGGESTSERLSSRLKWLSENADNLIKCHEEKFSEILSLEKFIEMVSR